MRLIKRLPDGGLELTSVNDDDPPPYAILSHTWTSAQEEVTYNELVSGTGKDKTGYAKIRFCADKAAVDGLQHCWVDTCCIDKSTSDELSTAINSMFRWYQRAAKCYVYLSDVRVPAEVVDAEIYRITWAEAFRLSRWFKRGWTLQELLAPATVEFFSQEGKRLGSKISLEQEIHQITEIPVSALRGQSLADFSIEERKRWATNRTTTMKEDKAYCLLGIFGVFLPPIYGEGQEHAILRLEEEVQKRQERREMKTPQGMSARLEESGGSDNKGQILRTTRGDFGPGSAHVTGAQVSQGNFVGETISKPFFRDTESLLTALDSTTARPEYAEQFSHSLIRPVKAFIPRPKLREQIRTQLYSDGGDTTVTLVVCGLGGAGKTQLVLDYIQQNRTDYKGIFWIEAGSKESLNRDIVNLYYTLYNQTSAEQRPVNVENAIIGVKNWFLGRPGPWLMVFDGADTIENNDDGKYIDIMHFIPDVASLHVIVTSRSSIAKDMTRLEGVRVGEMEEAQAVELFYRSSLLQRDRQEVEDEIKKIVKELGYLALAVALAATYVGRTPRLQSDIAAYIHEYRRRRRELLSRKPERLIHQYDESVLTTWEASYQAVKEQCADAANLMTILSFLNSDDIFFEIFGFYGGPENNVSNEDSDVTLWKALGFGQMVDVYKLEEWFGILQKYSLVQWRADRQSYTMHKLVHAWGYDRLAADDQRRFTNATPGLFKKAIVQYKARGGHPKDTNRLLSHFMADVSIMFVTLCGSIQSMSSDVNFFFKKGEVTRELVGSWIEELRECDIQRFAMREKLRIGVDKMAEIRRDLELMKRVGGNKNPELITSIEELEIKRRDSDRIQKEMEMQHEELKRQLRIVEHSHQQLLQAMHTLKCSFGDLRGLKAKADALD